MIARQIGKALRIFLIMTVITGLIYPLLVSGLGLLIFPHQTRGSIIYKNGKGVGSALIGQNFTSEKYFHGRPSIAGVTGYDGTASGGSNLGPTNKKLLERITGEVKNFRKENYNNAKDLVPSDMVTASASGLDPDITPEGAYAQVKRIAQARKMSVTAVKELVSKHIEKRRFGILGEPRVNVLQLNLALDAEERT